MTTPLHQTLESPVDIPDVDLVRSTIIKQKQKRIRDWLETQGYDALLIQNPCNYAWFTAGSEPPLASHSSETASLFLTSDSRVVLCNNIDSSQIFDVDLFGLGFQLKERSWQEPLSTLVQDICQGRKVASDSAFPGTIDCSKELAQLRLPLSKWEARKLQEIGKDVAHAVEATGRHCQQGQTEAEIAGQVSHRMVKRGIVPVRIQVWVDGRCSRYHHSRPTAKELEKFCTILAIGRKEGLSIGLARTLSFGTPPLQVAEQFQKATLAQATGLCFTQSGKSFQDVWDRVKRIYEKLGHPDQWQSADQVEVTGYQSTEIVLRPQIEYQFVANTALFWHASIESAIVGDSLLIEKDQVEILTPTKNWPKLNIEVKGNSVPQPNILVRKSAKSQQMMIDTDQMTGDSILMPDSSVHRNHKLPSPATSEPPEDSSDAKASEDQSEDYHKEDYTNSESQTDDEVPFLYGSDSIFDD